MYRIHNISPVGSNADVLLEIAIHNSPIQKLTLNLIDSILITAVLNYS